MMGTDCSIRQKYRRAPYSGVVGIAFFDADKFLAVMVPPRSAKEATEKLADIIEAALNAAENSEQTHETSEGQTKPNEPTLTCSEVVERLPAKEFLKLKRDQWTDLTGYKFAGKPTIDDQACQFAEAYADAILHSWRERRVQELENLLAKHSLSPELSSTQLDTTKEKVMTTEIRNTETLGKYGHHPDQLIDSDVELDRLTGLLAEAHGGLLRALDYRAATPEALAIKADVRDALRRTGFDMTQCGHRDKF